MGGCTSKPSTPSGKPNPFAPGNDYPQINDFAPTHPRKSPLPTPSTAKASPFFPFYTPSPARHRRNKSRDVDGGGERGESKSLTSTPLRQLRRAFHPPSPAKHIRAALRRRRGKKEAALSTAATQQTTKNQTQEEEEELGLDKRFGFSKEFHSRVELGEEIGRGHFGYTCSAKFKKGELKGQVVAVKIIPKSKMTTAIAIEDVRREVKILQALSGHKNLVQFYDAFEDNANVYIAMELCEGGELLDRILARGGKYSENDAKPVIIQILNVVAFCHLQGVVHRDLKPENFLYTTKEENSQLKAIDFGLSDFVRPDERLNDIVGSAYYVAPEVLHRSYTTEADVWSIGVIAYILLCGSRPFWARTESGIFRAVLKADPRFDEPPWPFLSFEAKDFVKRLLFKDPRRRMSASQALMHPWIRGYNTDMNIPFDILIFRQMKAYLRSSPLRKAALRALSKTLIKDEILYLKTQFSLLAPNKDGLITLDSIRLALASNATEAMKESRIPDFLALLNGLQYRGMGFEEFCAAAINVHQHESLDCWEQSIRHAYELFDKNGNRAIVIEELASELGVGPTITVHSVLNDWIRHTDGKLSFFGFVKLLHGVSVRSSVKTLSPPSLGGAGRRRRRPGILSVSVLFLLSLDLSVLASVAFFWRLFPVPVRHGGSLVTGGRTMSPPTAGSAWRALSTHIRRTLRISAIPLSARSRRVTRSAFDDPNSEDFRHRAERLVITGINHRRTLHNKPLTAVNADEEPCMHQAHANRLIFSGYGREDPLGSGNHQRPEPFSRMITTAIKRQSTIVSPPEFLSGQDPRRSFHPLRISFAEIIPVVIRVALP